MQLNDRPYLHWRQGMSIQDVIDERNFIYPKLVVKLNGKLIRKEDYAATLVAEEDDLITGTADTLDNAVSNEM